MKPCVLNRRHGAIPPDAIYVGRPTRYGNPFVIGRDGTREQVIAKYADTLYERLSDDDIAALRGHDLVCWCAPERCHADVLLAVANKPDLEPQWRAEMRDHGFSDAEADELWEAAKRAGKRARQSRSDSPSRGQR